jgi:hypothetical protein
MSMASQKKRERWLAGGQLRSSLYLALVDASYREYEREFLALEKKLLRSDTTPLERLETRRRIAEDLLMGAFDRPSTWEDFQRALRRIERLGYTDVGKRVHVACLFAQAHGRAPSQAPQARELLQEAERRLRRLPRKHLLRKEGLEDITYAKHVAGWPLSPEEQTLLRKLEARRRKQQSK